MKIGVIEIIGLNVIWVFSPKGDKVLMCKRHKDPYKGLYNFVGGKIEANETRLAAAYRELAEETGITEIKLHHIMDFTYHKHENNLHFTTGSVRVEDYYGTLAQKTEVSGDEKELVWLDVTENFFDKTRFAGEGNIGHILEIIKQSEIKEA